MFFKHNGVLHSSHAGYTIKVRMKPHYRLWKSAITSIQKQVHICTRCVNNNISYDWSRGKVYSTTRFKSFLIITFTLLILVNLLEYNTVLVL